MLNLSAYRPSGYFTGSHPSQSLQKALYFLVSVMSSNLQGCPVAAYSGIIFDCSQRVHLQLKQHFAHDCMSTAGRRDQSRFTIRCLIMRIPMRRQEELKCCDMTYLR